MLKKLSAFFRPNGVTIFIFLALVLLMPVLYIYSEPERTNYLPEEEQHWIIKVKQYPGILDEYFLHTDGNFDTLLGIIERDYYSNYIGVLLLFFYYFVASCINNLIHKIRHRK
jgi:hypothetical protein